MVLLKNKKEKIPEKINIKIRKAPIRVRSGTVQYRFRSFLAVKKVEKKNWDIGTKSFVSILILSCAISMIFFNELESKLTGFSTKIGITSSQEDFWSFLLDLDWQLLKCQKITQFLWVVFHLEVMRMKKKVKI